MLSSLRNVARPIVLICLLSSGMDPMQGSITRGADFAGDEVARAEVRALRKLHLVRPDLIPYPIAYEVCC